MRWLNMAQLDDANEEDLATSEGAILDANRALQRLMVQAPHSLCLGPNVNVLSMCLSLHNSASIPEYNVCW